VLKSLVLTSAKPEDPFGTNLDKYYVAPVENHFEGARMPLNSEMEIPSEILKRSGFAFLSSDDDKHEARASLHLNDDPW